MALLSSEISTKNMVPICRQLATAYDAGIPIVRSLEMMSDNARDSRTKRVMRAMSEQIQNGSTLGEAASSQAQYLNPFFVQLLATGETGGRLDVTLKDLAEFYEDKQELRRTVVSAMFYPCIQLLAAWFLGTFALRLVGILNPMSGKRFDIGEYFTQYGYFQLKAMLVFAAVVGVFIALSRIGVLKWIVGWVTNHVWPIKWVARRFALARFFRSMSLLIGSGIHIRHCIERSAAMAVNPYIERDLLQAAPLVQDGASLVQAFAPCRSLTRIAREMLVVGEQSGRLDETLAKVAQYHQQEAKEAVKRSVVLLGVAILVGMAGLVGFIVISFYSRLYGGMLDGLGV